MDGLGLQAVQQVEAAGDELRELRVFVGEEAEFDAIEIRLFFRGGAPIVGIALEADGFTGFVFADAEGSETRDFIGRRGDAMPVRLSPTRRHDARRYSRRLT